MTTQPLMIVFRGLPACGKTHTAKALCELFPATYKRVNKDDLRESLGCLGYNRYVEKVVTESTFSFSESLLEAGFSVISDNTNLNPYHLERYWQVAQNRGVPFCLVDFKVTVGDCVNRDDKRKDGVGEAVIDGMVKKWMTQDSVRPEYHEFPLMPKVGGVQIKPDYRITAHGPSRNFYESLHENLEDFRSSLYA